MLLAILFFILVGYLMEANGMVRLIELFAARGRADRGGLNVDGDVDVLFSGISGSKMATSPPSVVLFPPRENAEPGNAALLAASAVMAETIPPCINLIILGSSPIFDWWAVVAGLLPAV